MFPPHTCVSLIYLDILFNWSAVLALVYASYLLCGSCGRSTISLLLLWWWCSFTSQPLCYLNFIPVSCSHHSNSRPLTSFEVKMRNTQFRYARHYDEWLLVLLHILPVFHCKCEQKMIVAYDFVDATSVLPLARWFALHFFWFFLFEGNRYQIRLFLGQSYQMYVR